MKRKIVKKYKGAGNLTIVRPTIPFVSQSMILIGIVNLPCKINPPVVQKAGQSFDTAHSGKTAFKTDSQVERRNPFRKKVGVLLTPLRIPLPYMRQAFYDYSHQS